jgi:hypothetical protein
MKVLIALLPIALLGCGYSGSSTSGNGEGYEANSIADRFDVDCRSAQAPNAKAAKELAELCSCSTKQIRSTIHAGDSREVTDSKIDHARLDCIRQVYPNGDN